MAVIYTLTIDCGDNEQSARDLAAAYKGMTIKLDGFDDLVCESWYAGPDCWWLCPCCDGDKTKVCSGCGGDWHKAIVQPVGFQQPKSPTITTEKNRLDVQNQLYRVLRGHDAQPPWSGYRVAFFGEEVQDLLCEIEWTDELTNFHETGKIFHGWKGMIFSAEFASNETLRKQLVPFSPGYLWYPHEA